MALIKCKECGKQISSSAEKCVHCGCPIKSKSKKKTTKKNLIPIIVGGIIIIVVLLIILLTGGDKLVCHYKNSSAVGTLEYKVTYNFKGGNIDSIEGYQYAKANNDAITSSLWSSTNNPKLQSNSYEGITYKATLSEDGEIKLNYSLDVNKAPSMFNSIVGLAGISGVYSTMNKDTIKSIYESNEFTCK